MLGQRYFSTYFGAKYYGAGIGGAAPQTTYLGQTYFGHRYFGGHYFGRSRTPINPGGTPQTGNRNNLWGNLFGHYFGNYFGPSTGAPPNLDNSLFGNYFGKFFGRFFGQTLQPGSSIAGEPGGLFGNLFGNYFGHYFGVQSRVANSRTSLGYFGKAYFGNRYFGTRYFGGQPRLVIAGSTYFGNRHFGTRYFGHRYFGGNISDNLGGKLTATGTGTITTLFAEIRATTNISALGSGGMLVTGIQVRGSVLSSVGSGALNVLSQSQLAMAGSAIASFVGSRKAGTTFSSHGVGSASFFNTITAGSNLTSHGTSTVIGAGTIVHGSVLSAAGTTTTIFDARSAFDASGTSTANFQFNYRKTGIIVLGGIGSLNPKASKIATTAIFSSGFGTLGPKGSRAAFTSLASAGVGQFRGNGEIVIPSETTGIFPDWNKPFDPYYDRFSMKGRDLIIPAHFDIYQPDNQEDAQCLSVIATSIEHGAKKWAMHNKWITIGIYRDEARPTTQRPVFSQLTWSRDGAELKINHPGHDLQVGDLINIYDVQPDPILSVPVEHVYSSELFSVTVGDFGDVLGFDAAWQPAAPTNFYEEYIVFRMLPSFNLLSIEDLFEIFADTTPIQQQDRLQMYDITAQNDVILPDGKSSTINYSLPREAVPKVNQVALGTRFDQIYDQDDRALPIKYREDGQPVDVDNVDSKYKNRKTHLNHFLVNEAIEVGNIVDQVTDSRIHIYDMYGSDLNDSSRGPYHSSNIIKRDPLVPGIENNVSRAMTPNGTVIYTGTLFDLFGNIVIGIQHNNALFVRAPILPLKLNRFNKPTKKPLPRRQT
jgi:hypothetical protein